MKRCWRSRWLKPFYFPFKISHALDFGFLALLALIAILYSSVGHGGASGYLALMAVYGFAPEVMKPTALLLNVCVALISALQFHRTEKPEWKLLLPLVAGSIPLAYLGASIQIDAELYKQLLGAVLIFQSIRLFGITMPFKEPTKPTEPGWIFPTILGAAIGLLSGLIGIGGGIILSPLLLHLRWCSVKQTAMLSAGFIFVNSISGLLAIGQPVIALSTTMGPGIMLAIVGGLLGGWLGSKKMNNRALQILLGCVLLFAGLKLLLV